MEKMAACPAMAVVALFLFSLAGACSRTENELAPTVRASATPAPTSSVDSGTIERARIEREQAGSDDDARVCTELGCMDSLRLELEQPFDGAYRWRVWLDGKLNSGTRTAATPHCSPGDSLCLDHDVLQFEAKPKRVRLEILQGGRVVRSGSFEPTYQCYRPNGADCDPECCSAEVVVKRSSRATM